ncbi:MAG: S1 family peptidase [Bacteriovoracia bacterium]
MNWQVWTLTLPSLGLSLLCAADPNPNLGRAIPAGVTQALRATATLIMEKLDAKGSVTSTGACTGFLVGKQLVLTNQHCIARRPEETVRTRVLFRAPQAPNRPNAERIQSYLSTQIVFETSLEDYALLRLEESVDIPGIQPLPIVGAAKPPKHPWKISSTFDNRYIAEPRAGYEPTIDLEICGGAGIEKHNWTLVACTARAGNSGSPLVNDAGEVVAIAKSIFQEIPPVAVQGTEYIVGDVPAIFATPMSFFVSSIRENPETLGRFQAQLSVDSLNYHAVGGIEMSWPAPAKPTEKPARRGSRSSGGRQ